MRLRSITRIAGGTAAAGAAIFVAFSVGQNWNHRSSGNNSGTSGEAHKIEAAKRGDVERAKIPTRAASLARLRAASGSSGGRGGQEEELDVLFIGGGATGCGAALDAAARGLRVACVEREDFASGTSSRSTKLM